MVGYNSCVSFQVRWTIDWLIVHSVKAVNRYGVVEDWNETLFVRNSVKCQLCRLFVPLEWAIELKWLARVNWWASLKWKTGVNILLYQMSLILRLFELMGSC